MQDQQTLLIIDNGSFESGNFSGWTTTTSSGGSAGVTTSNAGYSATDGTYFANLSANSVLSQDTSWGIGDMMTFDWNFNANDYLPYNDYSVFQIIDDSNNVLENITLSNVAATGNYNATGWNTYEYTFTSAATGSINFGVYNVLDGALDSQLYIDNVASVPEPTSIALLVLGLAGIGMAKKKKSA